MTLFWKTLSLAVLVVLILTGVQNNSTDVSLTLLSGSLVEWPLGLVILVCALLGAVTMAGLVMPLLAQYRQKNQRSMRTAEKLEVTAESSGEKVKALEAKIQTLEKALDDALARR